MTFPSELLHAVWHTTSIDRYRSILSTRFILPNPPVPDGERWKTVRGPEFHPYVRHLGGVSLFDFREFDENIYSDEFPLSSWHTFVPYRKEWGASVWIEVDPDTLGEAFLSGEALLRRWKEDAAWRHTVMPKIEAASLCPVPVDSFRRVFVWPKGAQPVPDDDGDV